MMRSRPPALELVRWLARLGLAGLFLYAAWPKLVDPVAFAQSIANYRLLPEPMVGFLAVVLPALELVAAVCLVVGPWSRGAATLIALMLFGFAAALLQALVRGIDLSCGCFGRLSEAQVDAWMVVRNLVLGLVALWIAIAAPTPKSQTPDPASPTVD